MWWLLVLALAPAQAERFVRCEAVWQTSTAEVRVPGFGATEDDARVRARAFAWRLARAERVAQVVTETVASPAAGRTRLIREAQSLGPEHDWQVPGATVVDGDCEERAVPGQRTDTFEVSWKRADRTVLRRDVAVGIEAARRRACFGAWQYAMVEAVERGAAAEDERYRAVHRAAREATDVLLACGTRVEPEVGLATVAMAEEAGPGMAVCARPRFRSAWTRAQGWGEHVEAARESALSHDVRLGLLRAEAALWAVMREGEPRARIARVQQVVMTDLGGLVVATDRAEQALTACEQGPPRSVRLAWDAPSDLPCDRWQSGTGAAFKLGAPAVQAEREARCVAPARQEWSDAAVRPEALVTCAESCLANASVVGWSGTPFQSASEPDLSTREAAARVLSLAVSARDFHLLGLVTGGVVFEPGIATVFKQNPQGFWASLDDAMSRSDWSSRAHWVDLGPTWAVGFAP